jgi:hypothetical protein
MNGGKRASFCPFYAHVLHAFILTSFSPFYPVLVYVKLGVRTHIQRSFGWIIYTAKGMSMNCTTAHLMAGKFMTVSQMKWRVLFAKKTASASAA